MDSLNAGDNGTQAKRSGHTTVNTNSCWQNLPFEILSSIFLLATELSLPINFEFQTSFNKYVIAPSRSKAPLSFTYVCSRWRAVALRVPQLWTAVSGTQDWTKSTTSGLFTLWMINAAKSDETNKGKIRKECALNLHLGPPRPSAPDSREGRRMVTILRTFWANIGRCRSLNLHLDRHTLLELHTLVLKIPPLAVVAPFLEDFEISIPSGTTIYDDFINDLIVWLNKLPALRRLRLVYSGIFNQSPLPIEFMPWSCLHEVHITCEISFKNSVSALAQCTSARTVRLTDMAWMMPTDLEILSMQLSTTTLHHLTSLTLADSSNPSALLEYLTLPALKNLTLYTQEALLPIDVSSFGAFLSRSQCSLERLITVGLRMSRFDTTLFLNLPEVVKAIVVDISFGGVARMFEHFVEDEEMRSLLGYPVMGKLMVWTSDIIGPERRQHVGWKRSLGKKDKILASLDGRSLPLPLP